MNDTELHRELESWKFDIPDDPGFQRDVWRKISTQEKSSILDNLDDLLERILAPRVAIPLTATVLAATAMLAVVHGKQTQETVWNQLAHNYGTSIDPISRVVVERL